MHIYADIQYVGCAVYCSLCIRNLLQDTVHGKILEGKIFDKPCIYKLMERKNMLNMVKSINMPNTILPYLLILIRKILVNS